LKRREKLLFISGTLPKDGYGSHIIFLRHLIGLEEAGYDICVASRDRWLESKPNGMPNSWQTIKIPDRKAFWLPARASSKLSMSLRFRAQASHVLARIDRDTVKAILTNVWDHYCGVAAVAAKRLSVPLHVFVHDDPVSWATVNGSNANYVKWRSHFALSRADKIFSVSQRLSNALNCDRFPGHELIRPIPAKNDSRIRSDPFSEKPVLGFMGKVYPGAEETLKHLADRLNLIGGTLVIVTDKKFHALLNRPNIVVREPFETAFEAKNYLLSKVSALVVAYPKEIKSQDQTAILVDNFPSKVLEYVEMGLPILLIAPQATEAYDFSRSEELLFAEPGNDAKLDQVLSAIAIRESYNRAQNTIQTVQTKYSFESINERLVRSIG